MNDTQPREVEHHRRGTASIDGNLQAVCVDYLQMKNFDLRSTTHDSGITKFPHSEKFCS